MSMKINNAQNGQTEREDNRDGTISHANGRNNHEAREDTTHGELEAENSTQLEEWSKAWEILIEELKSDSSNIQLIFTAKTTQKAKAEMILKKYASSHDLFERAGGTTLNIGKQCY